MTSSDAPPEKIRLVPDEWHLLHVGRLADGRQFWIDAQLEREDGRTTDFVCTFTFDADGNLVSHSIQMIGVRGSYPEDSFEKAGTQHVESLGQSDVADIWVRPFQVDMDKRRFGLIPRQTEDGEWRVEAMPGNTLSFFSPWDAGEYDT